MCWAIWIARNRAIFDQKLPHWPITIAHIIADLALIPDDPPSAPPRSITPELIDKSFPWAYFDGSAQEDGCGGGGLLYLWENHSFSLQFPLGRGTNNYAELSTAKHLISFALEKGCTKLQLFGDSMIVCNWLTRKTSCTAFSLRHILDEALRLTVAFEKFDCRHIYRERNTQADYLSKQAAQRQEEDWLIQEDLDGTYFQRYHRPFDDFQAQRDALIWKGSQHAQFLLVFCLHVLYILLLWTMVVKHSYFMFLFGQQATAA